MQTRAEPTHAAFTKRAPIALRYTGNMEPTIDAYPPRRIDPGKATRFNNGGA